MSETDTDNSAIALITSVVKRAVSSDTGMMQAKNTARVECYYATFCVSLQEAEKGRKEFVRLLRVLDEAFTDESLKRGVAYDRVANLATEGRVSMLEIFALGKALGLWEIVTPKERRRNPALNSIVFDRAEFGSIGIIRLSA